MYIYRDPYGEYLVFCVKRGVSSQYDQRNASFHFIGHLLSHVILHSRSNIPKLYMIHAKPQTINPVKDLRFKRRHALDLAAALGGPGGRPQCPETNM